MDSNFLAIIASGAGSATPSRSPPPVVGGFGDASGNAGSALPPLEWGPSLVLIRDHMAVCGGQLGKSNTFCCALSNTSGGGCSVGKHAVFKHPLVSDPATLQSTRLYFHKGKKSRAVFAEPYLDLKVVGEENLVSLMATVYKSWDEWKEAVLVWKAAQETNQSSSVVRAAVTTAKKLPKLGRGGSLEDLDEGICLKWQETLSERMDTLVGVMEKLDLMDLEMVGSTDEEEEVPENPQSIRNWVRLLRDAIVELNEVSVEGLKELHLGLGVRLMGLEEALGKMSATETKYQKEGYTVLGMLDDLQMQLDEFRNDAFVKEVNWELFKSNEMRAFAEGIKAAFEEVRDQFVEVREVINRIKEQNKSAKTHKAASVSSWFGDRMTNKNEENPARGLEWHESIETLTGRVDALETSLLPGNQAEGEDILVAFKGMHFANERDVKMYVKALCGGTFKVPPGLIMDAYAVFHNLNREIFDSKSKLTVVDLARVSTMAMLQADVHNVLAGVEHGVPDFFDPPSSGGKIYIDGKHGKKHRFSNIPSHEIRGPIGTRAACVRKQAETQLTRLVSTKRGAIEDEIENAELKAFLTAMLDVSKDFVTAVFTFLTEEYSSLNQHFCDSTVCWDFACSCVEHVFKYEFEAARSILSNPDVGNPDIASKLMWQSLRTISIQEGFLRVGFKNHPSLSSAYSRFLLTQYQQTSLELNTMTKEVETQKRKVAELTSGLETLEKRLKAAEGTANAAQNVVLKFKKGST